ncbi:heme/hemin ABC transporter substrate-binding protein [Marinobacter zhejiangensis]|uniref:Iron complex transport system substrate-binding protein n=1 Tax=Marinobacter zhejiangensis TaxID=488535 RepID=A0A1I4TNP5_9GAMM|nr:ABC transporter substrate-binding protein [Marinobacter zhejiangensis]SFM78286.1 iron complex transport system substrate-binding protein [Marinobacter zhejiangensis]
MRLMVIALAVLVSQGALAASPVGSVSQQRVVSADGAITETIFALGGGASVVGVDTTSTYPAAVQALPKVGYLRALPFEGVLSLQPDRLITTEDAAPEQALGRLERAGVRVERLPIPRTPEQSLARIEQVGALIGRDAAAAELITRLDHELDAVTAQAEARGWRPRVLFILSAGNHGVVFGGAETGADALLQSLNADNAMAAVSGYKPASREAVIASTPDAIVIAEAWPGQFQIDDWPELARLPAWQAGHRYVGDSMFLLGFGPRLPEAMAAVNGVLPSRAVPLDGH